ncbi:MAG: hypothetical protein Q8R26_00375 [bacterium]|nr:hypothetical protein [bacterium]
MVTVLFSLISSVIREVAASIGKFQIANQKESIYTALCINAFFVAIAFGILTLVRDSFVFSLASLRDTIIFKKKVYGKVYCRRRDYYWIGIFKQ